MVVDRSELGAGRVGALVDLLATLPIAPGATIRGTTDVGASPSAASPSAASPAAASPSVAARPAHEVIEIGELIDEGGMGLIHAASQRSVAREVAIKSLRPEKRDARTARALLQEAWLTAALEHPNIVPVHEVIVDHEQGPLIVMKRVRGVPWSSFIADPTEIARRFQADDAFEHNLGIWLQLCRAVHYAHANAIVHRDIKPSNVMVGAFGEVYLLDWGIAASLKRDPSGRLPAPGARRGIVGTLAYMAPEMLDHEVGPVGVHTDVYLLGAVLYEVATGRAPHDHPDLRETAESILASEPVFGEGVSAELRQIIARAMSRDPAERYESVEALRLAVQRFQRGRESMRLVDEALERFAELSALLEADDEPKARIFELFGECRFGLQQALVGWSDNPRARAAMSELLDRMVAHLLEAGDPGAAGALLAEHPEPDLRLRARVEEGLERQRREREQLDRLQRELDPRIGATTRRAALVAMGVVWTLAPLLANLVDPTAVPAVVNYASPLLLLALALGVWYRARASLAETAINRRFLVAMLVGFCSHMVHLLVVQLAAFAPRTELPMGMVSFGAIAAVLAYTAERRLWPMVPLYWLGALVAAAMVPAAAYVLSGCNLVLTLYLFAIRPGRATAAEIPR